MAASGRQRSSRSDEDRSTLGDLAFSKLCRKRKGNEKHDMTGKKGGDGVMEWHILLISFLGT